MKNTTFTYSGHTLYKYKQGLLYIKSKYAKVKKLLRRNSRPTSKESWLSKKKKSFQDKLCEKDKLGIFKENGKSCELENNVDDHRMENYVYVLIYVLCVCQKSFWGKVFFAPIKLEIMWSALEEMLWQQVRKK